MLAAGVHDAGRGVDVEVTDAGEEGEVEQLGELGADLAGVGVHRVATDEDEVERADVFERGGERPCRGQRVGAGERGVGHEHAVGGDVAFDRPRQRLAQHVLGRGRSEGHEGHGVVRAVVAGAVSGERLRELDRLRDRTPAVWVHLEVEAVALQPPVGAELHLLERRDLLDQGCDAHRRTLPNSRFGVVRVP